jgi:hypothetical protein
MTIILCLKLILVPSLIGAVTLAGRRWGATIAGWLSAFPIISGPILLFIALDHGAAFAATAAAGTLSAVLAILAFCGFYGWAATRFGWPLSLCIGFIGYALAVAGLALFTLPLAVSCVAVAAALLLAPYLYPAPPAFAASPNPSTGDIPLRMITGGCLVLLVTHFAARLGPHLSGVFAMFPVMGSVLAVFSHRNSGAAFTINLLRGMILGFYAFSVFCLVLALTLPALSVFYAFLAALGAAFLIQGVTHILLRRAATAAPAMAKQGDNPI